MRVVQETEVDVVMEVTLKAANQTRVAQKSLTQGAPTAEIVEPVIL